MSSPAVDQTLKLVEDLRSAVRDFAAREEKVTHEYRIRTARLRQQHEQAVEELNKRLEEQVAQAEQVFQAGRDKAEARHQQRKTKITHAHRAARKQRLDGVDHREGTRKHRLQTDTLNAERSHKDGLDANEQNYEQFKACLAEDAGALGALETRAAKSFGSYRSFRKLLSNTPELPKADSARDEYELLNEERELTSRTTGDLKRFRRMPLPLLFKSLPLWIVLSACLVGAVPVLQQLKITTFTYPLAGACAGALLVLALVLHFVGKKQAEPQATKIAAAVGRIRLLQQVCGEKCELRHTQEIERIEGEFAATNQRIEREWLEALEDAAEGREVWPAKLDQKVADANAHNEQFYARRLELLQNTRDEKIAAFRTQTEARIAALTKSFKENDARLNEECESRWRPMELEWKTKMNPIYQAIADSNAAAEKLYPPWEPQLWAKWKAPAHFAHSAKFATLKVDLPKLAEAMPKDPRLTLPGPAQFSVPLELVYPQQGSILFEMSNAEREAMLAALNNVVLRLLSNAPPGRLSFTVIDPVGLGQSFSGVMHLADYAEHVINNKIWTQSSQIEQKLAELNEHMEKVIQMYLRNEYATIAEYNEQAGNIAEKYHFLVVADFPVGFTETAAKRLLSIAASGARCGVYTLIHWDRRQPTPADFVPEDLRRSSVCISTRGSHDVMFTGKSMPGAELVLDPQPAPEFAIDFIQKIGLASRDSNRIEVPFEHVIPPENEMWTMDTTQELRVAIGRTGATKLQYMAIGKGTRQHGLLAGKTGSGKSTLFHVLITNLALWCSPEQVEFYLVDFKKGVEFKCYGSRRLPHARVVAIESDREFGLSVLQRVDDELKRRGDWFRQLGVQDIAGYKRAGGKEPIPRTLLIIDEFQEFFVEDDKIAQSASLLLDRIVRQGRAFGIHVLLGSQTLGGAYTVARTTLGQMVIRIALQCNEADAYLIMDDTNPAPRLLSRPGEGIYNDEAGALQGNSPFQVVWLADELRDSYLAKVRARADLKPTAYPGPIVFEGNAPANVRENFVLQQLLQAPAIKPPQFSRIWLGAPNSIKGPTEAVFHRQSGNNLLIVGQRDEATLSMFSVALISLAAQYPKGAVRFIVLDGSPPGMGPREYLEQVVAAIPHPVNMVKQNDLAQVMSELVADMKARNENESAPAPTTFLFLHGLQKFNKLRYEEDFSFSSGDADAPANPSALLNTLLTEGTRLGFHVIAACDTYNNVNRYFSRKAFTEFEMRVLFQMSANDSASLIDSPKASILGLHRALFFNEQQGYLETFRPYALPGSDWIKEAAQNLARLLG